MKRLILIVVFLVLYSCAAIDTNRIAPGYTEAFKSLRNVFFGYEQEIDPELIEKIPYASMLVKIGKGPQSLMILESTISDQYIWVSADGVYIVIKDGRIIRTSGLSNNLFKIESPQLKWEEIIFGDQIYTSYYSFLNPTLNNLKITSIFKMYDKTEENLVFETKDLRLVEENIASEAIDWKKENKYWIDETGFAWKSIQYISPKLPPVYIEVTKKPR